MFAGPRSPGRSPRRREDEELIEEIRRDLRTCVKEVVQESFHTLGDQLLDDVRKELRSRGQVSSAFADNEMDDDDDEEIEEQEKVTQPMFKRFDTANFSTKDTSSRIVRKTKFRMNGTLSASSFSGSKSVIMRKRPSAASPSFRSTYFPAPRELTTERSDSSYAALFIMEERQSLAYSDSNTEEFQAPVERSLRHRAQDLISHQLFEHAICVMVVLNAVLLGVETDYACSGGAGPVVHALLDVSESFFCIIFSLELGARLYAHQWEFLLVDTWAWNIFDFLVVAVQVSERLVNFFINMHISFDTTFMRLLRVLRLVRITRLVRLVRLVEELGTITSSIMASLTALFWTLLLLVMLMYIVSVFFTQIIVELHDSTHAKKIHYWYGRLPRSLLTMFEVIAGGVSWDEVVTPLIEDISPFAGVIFSGYVAFCVFAMLNMATGVFVDRAIRKAQEDTDTSTTNHISNLFFTGEDVGGVSFTEFNEKMDTQEMQDYFKSINVDPSEAKSLFELLDTDGSGTIDAEELVAGCLRLRGNAKALELQVLVRMTQETLSQVLENQRILSQEISTLGSRKSRRMTKKKNPPMFAFTFNEHDASSAHILRPATVNRQTAAGM